MIMTSREESDECVKCVCVKDAGWESAQCRYCYTPYIDFTVVGSIFHSDRSV